MGESVLMLGISGCRGIVGETLSPDVAARYAAAFGSWLCERAEKDADGRPCVVIGRDGRAGGHVLAHAAIAGLCSAGCDVVDLGVAMTPTVGVMVDELDAAGGMVLTASHNPQQWNGLKCLIRDRAGSCDSKIAACAPSAADASEIVARFKAIEQGQIQPWQQWNNLGDVRAMRDAARVHVDRVVSRFGEDVIEAIRAMKPTVVLDSVNGAGVTAGRMLLERLGCRVVHLGNEQTGIFPHKPEPTRENLTGAGGICQAVTQQNAIVGFAQDPDADRLAIVDEQGNYIGEEYTFVLAAGEVFAMGMAGREKQSRATAVNLSTSRMIEDVAAEFGVQVVRSAVGEANVVEAMKQNEMVIGGEGNGGVIWSSVTFVRDSLGAMALVLSALVRQHRQISELVGAVPGYAIEKRKVAIANREVATQAGERVADWAEKHNGRVDRQDGVRVDFTECTLAGGGPAWVHIRASNTEPIMRLIAEAKHAEGASCLLDALEPVIQSG